MSGTEVSLTKLLEQVIALALQSMDGPVVGKVNSYDSTKNRANVTPLVPLLVAGEWEPTPTLPEVPVAWPGGPSHSYKFPIVGGLVQLAPLGHDHSDWTVSGAAGIPAKSERRFSIADLVAYPLAPSPLATPPDPLSYSAAAAVLFGETLIGGADAVKAVALNADNNPAVALMAAWMTQVEVICNSVLFPPPVTPVFPLSSTFNATAISSITATATKAKAK